MVPHRRSRPRAAAASPRRSSDRGDLDGVSARAPGIAASWRARGPPARRVHRKGASGMSDKSLAAAAPQRGLLSADPVGDFDGAAPRVSFEFFPPKTPEMEARLWEVIKRLESLGPRFVSVTYGAGGSTRERTHATVRRIRNETALEPAAHLTCVAATCDEVDDVARQYW